MGVEGGGRAGAYLGPLAAQLAALVAILHAVQLADGLVTVTLVAHVDKSKACIKHQQHRGT